MATVSEFISQATDDGIVSFLKEVERTDLTRVMLPMDEATRNRIFANISAEATKTMKNEIEQVGEDKNALRKSTKAALAIIAMIDK